MLLSSRCPSTAGKLKFGRSVIFFMQRTSCNGLHRRGRAGRSGTRGRSQYTRASASARGRSSTASTAAQIVAADPTTYPAYLLNQPRGGAASVYICGANYGQEVFDVGPEWTLCVYQGPPANAHQQPPGPGGTQQPGSIDEAVELLPNFEQYCHFMHDRGERLTEAELHQRYEKYCRFMQGNAPVWPLEGSSRAPQARTRTSPAASSLPRAPHVTRNHRKSAGVLGRIRPRAFFSRHPLHCDIRNQSMSSAVLRRSFKSASARAARSSAASSSSLHRAILSSYSSLLSA
mmetsp:Transcript_100591/g.288242  ORF Transcript_100591/g.288242 Transcript_100591/m.288242 type:complete len:289 (-) Transcript_100591:958-1824(-)